MTMPEFDRCAHCGQRFDHAPRGRVYFHRCTTELGACSDACARELADRYPERPGHVVEHRYHPRFVPQRPGLYLHGDGTGTWIAREEA